MDLLFLRLWKAISLLFCSVPMAKWALGWSSGTQLRKHPLGSASTSRRSCGALWMQTSPFTRNNNDGQNQLLSKGRLSTPFEDMKILMEPMIVYFDSMVDPDTLRFFMFSYPQSPNDSDSVSSMASFTSQTSLRSHAHCPLRDMGSAWDACKAIKVLRHCYKSPNHDLLSANLENSISETIGYYASSLEVGDALLSPELLRETSKISHSALLLLGLTSSEDLGVWKAKNTHAASVDALTLGILSMQRPDGAFATQFCRQKGKDGDNGDDDDVHTDIAFSPGQAMTALMEVHSHPGLVTEKTRDQILPSMKSACEFYRDYYEKGRQENNIDVNYSVWQIQAFARLASTLQKHDGHSLEIPNTLKHDVAVYCMDLCQDILQSPAWKLVSRGNSFYPNLSTIEIACGLDALCQGYRVLLEESSIHREDYEGLEFSFAKHIDAALDFLKWSQDQIPQDSLVGKGGLGHGGYWVKEQRIDVTGHAIGAVTNLVLPH